MQLTAQQDPLILSKLANVSIFIFGWSIGDSLPGFGGPMLDVFGELRFLYNYY